MYKKSALCLWGFAQSFCRSVPALGLEKWVGERDEGAAPRRYKSSSQEPPLPTLSLGNAPRSRCGGPAGRPVSGCTPALPGALPARPAAWTPRAVGRARVTYLLPRGSQRTRVAVRTASPLGTFRTVLPSGTRWADLPLQVRRRR